MFAVIGLGNPGKKYAQTRHNIGFWVLDALAETLNAGSWQTFGGCEVVKGKKGGSDILLVKPLRFMNLSGQAAQEVLAFYKVGIEDIVVIHDDLDLGPGQIRVVKGSKSGGHRGVEDLQRVLGSADFVRIRVGIGHPRELAPGIDFAVTDWVLGVPGNAELAVLRNGAEAAELAVETLLSAGLTVAQNRFNRRTAGESDF